MSDGFEESIVRRVCRYALSALFLISGVSHFKSAPAFISIVPGWLPRADLVVAVSGAAELLLAIALFYAPTRRAAALLLAVLMLAVWPANFNMALHPERFDAFTPALLWFRVVLQVPMLFWAVYAGGIWPRPSRVTAQSENRSPLL